MTTLLEHVRFVQAELRRDAAAWEPRSPGRANDLRAFATLLGQHPEVDSAGMNMLNPDQQDQAEQDLDAATDLLAREEATRRAESFQERMVRERGACAQCGGYRDSDRHYEVCLDRKVKVSYKRWREPVSMGNGLQAFGTYVAEYPDGFRYLSTHQARPGTVSAEPVDLDLNPEFRKMLIQDGERYRVRHPEYWKAGLTKALGEPVSNPRTPRQEDRTREGGDVV